MRLSNIVILIILSVITSCVDPFIPETTSYDDVLYIEGLLNNNPEQRQQVKIARSSAIISSTGINSVVQPAKVSGAHVVVIENETTEHIFLESEQGLYLGDTSFIPQTGNSYQLTVIYEGNIYASDKEIMLGSTDIDSISHKTANQKISETSPVYDGYKFFVSTHNDEDNGPCYYRWQSDATYFFRAFYDATHIWDRSTQIPANNNAVKFCWSSNKIKGIYVQNTEGLAENKIIEAPLHFQSQYGDALSIRYSINVKQYNISRTSWKFWNDMAQQVNNNGGMYDTQPFRIEGNIRCTSDPSVFVTGIFEAAGYSDKRIYVDKPTEFEIIPVVCQWDTIGTRDLPWWRIPRNSYIVFDYDAQAYMYAAPQCFDCTLKNGTLDKPSFWEDGE